MATPDNPLLVPAAGAPLVDRVIPVTETLLNPFNLAYVVVIGFVGIAAAVLLHPADGEARTLSADEVEKILPSLPDDDPAARDAGGALRSLPGLDVARGAALRIPARRPDLDPRLRGELEHQRVQHGVPRDGARPPRAPAPVPAGLPFGPRHRVGIDPAVPALRRAVRRDAGDRPRRVARRGVRAGRARAELPAARLRVLRADEPLRAVRRLRSGSSRLRTCCRSARRWASPR